MKIWLTYSPNPWVIQNLNICINW